LKLLFIGVFSSSDFSDLFRINLGLNGARTRALVSAKFASAFVQHPARYWALRPAIDLLFILAALALEVSRKRGVVYVQPKVVVEVLAGEVQKSPRYRSGLALRFARIIRIRDDKPARETDTLDTVRGLYEEQFRYKGRRVE